MNQIAAKFKVVIVVSTYMQMCEIIWTKYNAPEFQVISLKLAKLFIIIRCQFVFETFCCWKNSESEYCRRVAQVLWIPVKLNFVYPKFILLQI